MSVASSRLRVGVDIGGTHTDLTMVDGDGRVRAVLKTATTPDDPTEGLITLLERAGDVRAMEEIVHGTTIGVNAYLQRTLPRIALITTDGFRDVLLFRRETKAEPYNLHWDKPAPLVRRRDIHTVRERIGAGGEVVAALDHDSVREVAQQLRAEGVTTVAVCLVHAYRNRAHEDELAAVFRTVHPEASLVLSSDVLPEWREFERAFNTVLNAALIPIMAAYLTTLSAQLAARSFEGELAIMQSNGGHVSASEVADRPLHTLKSGVASGVVGACHLCAQSGARNLITIDMGGTSTDVSLVEDLTPQIASEYFLEWEGLIRTPAFEVQSIGAGGGSIAWIDSGGSLHVGPRSAGAVPGPVCYSRGGTEVTVTDVNLFLGYLNPDGYLGGEVALSVGAAEEALARLGVAYGGLAPDEMALGILRIVNANMWQGVRRVSVERGHDPREFTLVAFGGAGGLHIAAIMREANIRRGIVPLHPGNTSALGMLASEPRVDLVKTIYTPLGELDREVFDAEVAALRERGIAVLRGGREVADTQVDVAVDLRYRGQVHELTVQAPPNGGGLDIAAVSDRFHVVHARAYGYSNPNAPLELVAVRVAARGPAPSLVTEQVSGDGDVSAALLGQRRAIFANQDRSVATEVPVFERSRLPAGSPVQGPAIVEERLSTVLVPPGAEAVVDSIGNLVINV